MKNLLRTFIVYINVFLMSTPMVFAQTAALMPNARQQYFDSQGNVVAGGSVGYYVPGTTTLKPIWLDPSETTPSQNPTPLDEGGYPEQTGQTYGNGSYRQIVKDVNGLTIWDNVTSSTGSGGGGGGSATVGDGDAVGTVKPWPGFIPPTQYVLAYGQAIVRSTFPEAFAALTSQQNVSCSSGSPTLTGVLSTESLPIGAPVESTCLNPGATIVSKTTNTVTVSSNAIVSDTTTARFFPYGNGDGSLTFNVPDLRGRAIAGRDNMGGIAASRLTSTYFGVDTTGLGANGGNQSQTLTIAQMPSHSHANTLNDPGHTHSYITGVLNTGGSGTFFLNLSNSGANAIYKYDTGSVTGNTTGITISNVNTGGGSAHTIVQPTALQNYIIKVLPDTNPNSFFGVASIGGMYGVINCGVGITCAGNTITAVSSTFSYPEVTVYNTGVINASINDQVVVIDRVSPATTTINLPTVAGRNLAPLRIVDWSTPLTTNVITVNPQPGETIFRLSSWTINSTSSGRAMTILYPSVTLNGWYVQ